MRRGVTLVECMLASAILGFLALSLFEGVIVSTGIAHENADLLAAEAVAWDAVWKRFNEDFEKLAVGDSVTVGLGSDAAPQLVAAGYAAPVLTVTVGLADETGFSRAGTSMKKISADVEWGPSGHRRSLPEERRPKVFRGNLGRAN